MTIDTNTYLAMSPDATEDQAQAAFVKRYGYKPEKVFRMYPGREWLAGPVPKVENAV